MTSGLVPWSQDSRLGSPRATKQGLPPSPEARGAFLPSGGSPGFPSVTTEPALGRLPTVCPGVCGSDQGRGIRPGRGPAAGGSTPEITRSFLSLFSTYLKAPDRPRVTSSRGFHDAKYLLDGFFCVLSIFLNLNFSWEIECVYTHM